MFSRKANREMFDDLALNVWFQIFSDFIVQSALIMRAVEKNIRARGPDERKGQAKSKKRRKNIIAPEFNTKTKNNKKR